LELEFYEEQEQSSRGILPQKVELKPSKSGRIDRALGQRSATPKRRPSFTKLSSTREFKTPNPKSSKS
jgi:hypothetical protein